MVSDYNLRNHNTLGPPEPTIPCLEPSCICQFYNWTGRSNHIRSKHPQFVLDPQQQANTPTYSNSIPGQASTGDDDLPWSPSESGSTVPVLSNSRSRSRESGDESIDQLGDNFNVDIVCGYEGDDQPECSCENQTQKPSAARSNNWDHDPVRVLPHINRTHHPLINGKFPIWTVIHIYFIFRNNLWWTWDWHPTRLWSTSTPIWPWTRWLDSIQ